MMQHSQQKASEQELVARYAQARSKLMGKARVVNVAPMIKARPLIEPPKPVKDSRRFFYDIPAWKLGNVKFNEHIIAYHRWMKDAEEKIIVDDPERTDLRPTMDEIALVVLEDFPEVSLKDVKGPSRVAHIMIARHVILYRIRKMRPDLSFPQISKWCGNRDHSCVYNSVRHVETMIKTGRFVEGVAA